MIEAVRPFTVAMPRPAGFIQPATTKRTFGRPTPVGDQVTFSGQKDLLAKFGIHVDAVKVDASADIQLTKAEKRSIIVNCLKTYEHAQKKRILNERLLEVRPDAKHISGRNFSSMVQLANGLTSPAVNSEFSRDDVFCGERSATVGALNKAIDKMGIARLNDDKAYATDAQAGLVVKRLFMSGAHRHSGTENVTDPSKDTLGSAPPCSDCQAWMATDVHFSPKTEIWTLNRDAGNNFTLKCLTVGTMLPFWGDKSVSTTQKPIETLPIDVSEKAQALMASDLFKKYDLNQDQIPKMMLAAQQEYKQNSFAEVSKKNGAVSAYMAPIKEIVTAGRFDITARWFNEPAKTVLENGFRLIKAKGHSTNPKDEALALAFAFYGDYPQPTVNTLGYLAQLERGEGANKTLIVRLENDRIKVRTLSDMMPYVYMSARVPREGGK